MDPQDVAAAIEVVQNAISAMQAVVDFAHAHQSVEPYLAEAELQSLQDTMTQLQAAQQSLQSAPQQSSPASTTPSPSPSPTPSYSYFDLKKSVS